MLDPPYYDNICNNIGAAGAAGALSQIILKVSSGCKVVNCCKVVNWRLRVCVRFILYHRVAKSLRLAGSS